MGEIPTDVDVAIVGAGAAGIEMSTHLYPETAAHLMRVTETAVARYASEG